MRRLPQTLCFILFHYAFQSRLILTDTFNLDIDSKTLSYLPFLLLYSIFYYDSRILPSVDIVTTCHGINLPLA